MGEGEDERPENFDQILEMTGLDPEQVRKYSVNWLSKWTQKKEMRTRFFKECVIDQTHPPICFIYLEGFPYCVHHVTFVLHNTTFSFPEAFLEFTKSSLNFVTESFSCFM